MAALMLGVQLGPAVAVEPALEQLAEIESMLANNDVDALRSYLDLHPELLEGDTPLAVLLRSFLRESANLTTFLGVGSDSPASRTPGLETLQPGGALDPDEFPVFGEGDLDSNSQY